ncbi:GNAT family N-acetyltransferase [Photobacterium halotolerans]|uniref:GNAT family N-acetyltransferase n=1 Tax=Photobacterium halotolerans TaxID=265726 RepID=UPI000485967F|nr:GNAT family N-acetyltransferase [Photobacterium halotolerans]
MSNLQYVSLDEIEPDKFIPILNKASTRKHLVTHDEFDSDLAEKWIRDKIEIDDLEGCIVRAITVDDELVGWCGIQLSELGYEIAIVVDDRSWGIGKMVFRSLISWAHDFGHEVVYIHLLHTRPEYEFLRKISQSVFPTEMIGDRFTTYELNVVDCLAGKKQN